MLNILQDRSYQTTKLLRRSQGVFSKTPRTLTSPAQFRIARLSAPEELTTTAIVERCSINNNIDRNTTGTVTPTHNCKTRTPDDGNAYARDWKLFPFSYKGTVPCKHNDIKKHFPPDRSIVIYPVIQYISDRRPCGVSPQQLDSVGLFFETGNRISLSRFLNGSAGYRTYSEDSLKSPGWLYCIQLTNVHKTEYEINHRDSRYMFGRRSIGKTV